jgi:hypothetical protein
VRGGEQLVTVTGDTAAAPNRVAKATWSGTLDHGKLLDAGADHVDELAHSATSLVGG